MGYATAFGVGAEMRATLLPKRRTDPDVTRLPYTAPSQVAPPSDPAAAEPDSSPDVERTRRRSTIW